LQTGTAASPVRTLLVAPLPTYSAISSAAAYKASLLVTAAPLLTGPLDAVRWDDPIGSKVAHLVNRQISLYTLCNSYALAPGGLDDSLAECLGLGAKGSLLPIAAEAQYKFVTSVPVAALGKVRGAAFEAGAEVSGLYTPFRYSAEGIEAFVAASAMCRAEEARLEMLVSARELQGVLAAVLEAHPSEEVAYDVYPLHNPGSLYGRGRVGELPLQVSLDTVLAQVTDALGLEATNAPRCSHRPGSSIGSLAVVSGIEVGSKLLHAATQQQVGAIITGGVSLSDLIIVDGTPSVLIDVGFTPSVAPGLKRLVAQLRDTFASDNLNVIYTE
jgi:putative NIF3 family GTP cyclohydrolase 1 type 2